MRYRELFSVFPRTMKSGRKVYYYQTYDEEGRRTSAKSTGAVRARDARIYCMKLYRAGLLGVNEKRTPTMAEFAQGWWDFKTCEYVKSRMVRRKISTSYVRIARGVLEKDILPTFANKRLSAITTNDVDKMVITIVVTFVHTIARIFGLGATECRNVTFKLAHEVDCEAAPTIRSVGICRAVRRGRGQWARWKTRDHPAAASSRDRLDAGLGAYLVLDLVPIEGEIVRAQIGPVMVDRREREI